jgi:N,N'-diacetyllegionaminate synthase
MIVAEIGQNHCADIELAKYLIFQAKANGADLVKFQLYDSTVLYGEKQNTELSRNDANYLFGYGQGIGIDVFFSVFDTERVAWCEEMGVKYYKLAYSQRNNDELISAINQTNKTWFGSGIDLYCIPKYPTELSDLHFNRIDFTEAWYGYSDHTIGLNACKIAIARGAKIIEKHFALDHQTGVDAPWSMTAEELRELAEWQRTVKCVL